MNTPTMIPVIAIDGPTASGKGAVAQAVAQRAGLSLFGQWCLVPFGRLAGLARAGWAAETELDVAHEQQLAEWASALDALLDETILLDGEDVSQTIRQESTGNMASKIATVGALRQALLQRQRDFAQAPGFGRGWARYGQCGLPDALAKIFLTADAQIRAERRYKQLIDKGFLLI